MIRSSQIKNQSTQNNKYCEDCSYLKSQRDLETCNNSNSSQYQKRLYYKEIACLLFNKK